MAGTEVFLWLGLGALLSVFYHGRWTVAVAPWFALVCLLHFARVEGPVAGFLWIWLALLMAYGFANRGVMPIPGVAYVGIFVVIALLPALAFLADRLLSPGVPGFASTLVFPLAWVALEFVSSRVNPFGTWGCLAYSQDGDLPLMQLASVTGISGIAFLIAWFASVVNWAWDHHFVWATVGPGILTYVAVLGSIYMAGGARLGRKRANEKTVRVAGIGWPDGLLEQREMMRVFDPQPSDPEREYLRQGFQRIHDKFLDDTRREARAGARIVVWPEVCALTFAEDEATFLERSQRVAREERIYLLMGMGTIHPGPRPVENKSVLIDPSGEMRWSYLKITAVPGLEARTSRRGVAPLPSDDTPYGRLAGAICFDMDFPPVIRQAGRVRADLLLVPASDWVDIGRLHLAMAVFRAVENGVAMVRVARWGHSAATDPYGRTLSFMDHFATAERAMVAQVPVTTGVRTVYARVGDWFAWLCVAAFLSLVVRNVIR